MARQSTSSASDDTTPLVVKRMCNSIQASQVSAFKSALHEIMKTGGTGDWQTIVLREALQARGHSPADPKPQCMTHPHDVFVKMLMECPTPPTSEHKKAGDLLALAINHVRIGAVGMLVKAGYTLDNYSGTGADPAPILTHLMGCGVWAHIEQVWPNFIKEQQDNFLDYFQSRCLEKPYMTTT